MVMQRQEFENYMRTNFDFVIFTGANIVQILKSLLTNDKTIGDTFRLSLQREEALIANYLAEWDAAPTDPDKEAVENSVVFVLGNESFNPDDAVLWPPSGGLFGDAMS